MYHHILFQATEVLVAKLIISIIDFVIIRTKNSTDFYEVLELHTYVGPLKIYSLDTMRKNTRVIGRYKFVDISELEVLQVNSAYSYVSIKSGSGHRVKFSLTFNLSLS